MWTIGQEKEFGTYNANMIFDEKGESILMVYGISQNTMLEELNDRDADGLAIARQVVNDHNTIAALREAGEKMAKSLRENKRVVDLGNTDDQWAFTPEDAEALAEWEAANK